MSNKKSPYQHQHNLKLVGAPEPYSENGYPSRQGKQQMLLRVPLQKHAQIKAWCKKHHVSIQDATLDLWDELLTGERVQPIKTHFTEAEFEREVFEYYSFWTGNIIRDNDRKAYLEIKDNDLLVIKWGIITAVGRNEMGETTSKINSFKYCTYVIRELSEQPFASDSINRILRICERRLLKFRNGEPV